MKNGFFEDQNGDKSNSRLMADIVIFVALMFSFILIYVGYKAHESTIQIATSAGLVFTTIAGPALLFLFLQKKEEGKQEEVKQNLTAKIENPDNKNLITPTT